MSYIRLFPVMLLGSCKHGSIGSLVFIKGPVSQFGCPSIITKSKILVKQVEKIQASLDMQAFLEFSRC